MAEDNNTSRNTSNIYLPTHCAPTLGDLQHLKTTAYFIHSFHLFLLLFRPVMSSPASRHTIRGSHTYLLEYLSTPGMVFLMRHFYTDISEPDIPSDISYATIGFYTYRVPSTYIVSPSTIMSAHHVPPQAPTCRTDHNPLSMILYTHTGYIKCTHHFS